MYRIPQESVLTLEQPLLKVVPHDQLKRLQRTEQRYCEKVLGNHEKTAKKLCKETQQPGGRSTEEVIKALGGMAKQLGQLKRKLEEIDRDQQRVVERTNVRLSHLDDLCRADTFESSEWRRWSTVKVDRVLVDFLMREGWSDTAEGLVRSSGLESMVDSGLFDQAQAIAHSLLDGNASEALKWCADNKNGLRKIKNTLEFQLRLQEFIELVHKGQKLDAIMYARTHLNPLVAEAAVDYDSERHQSLLLEMQRAMTLLALSPDTTVAPYCELYAGDRWRTLRNAFLAAHVELHSLPLRSLLSVSLQAGLSTLKTMQCASSIAASLDSDKDAKAAPNRRAAAQGPRAAQCPVCVAPLDVIAARLPRAHHEHSSIICRISGRVLGSEEVAGCGPNGQVYSWKALEALAAQTNGHIQCPATGDRFTMQYVKRVFIM
ncbi:CTLH/CRA C-terminal to lish motif domain-containing protein [Thamnocephalis sphaerospora]|uniref:CTLH/CRA C-terminal to lish motif domain-containing protein n=1 Tax=Thamnocephalis sphaerospora TaxID=78915 RepID=A0A4P9XRN7_9FUNG|nr:CTLH/CRA C-terminal to lish motif domain-containing protein [Thamnocephalis sphaerospora]|eukprot:RKP08756.1 CTLH/CRA C-terminal to lish motif domain-containing protein [Thamnocephalis sphaerospora]